MYKCVAQTISQDVSVKAIVYPTDNQRWERLLLHFLKNNSRVKSFGLKNAPCPLLSTRFYFSKILVDHLPLPDAILVNGEISY